MSIITSPPAQTSGRIPPNARDLVPHEANSVFLGWTYRIHSVFPWGSRWYHLTPGGTGRGLPSSSLTDAVNHLRGPHGLDALYDENA